MKLFWRVSGLAGLTAGCLAMPAFAQLNEFDAELTIVGASIDADGSNEAMDASARFGLGVEHEKFLNNGLQVGFAAKAILESRNTDHYEFYAPEAEDQTLRSSANSQALSVVPLKKDKPKGVLQAAYVYMKGGWGEVSVGRDDGAATRLDARAPRISKTISVGSGAIDPTGAATIRARNDVTGPSEKISIVSKRLVGFKLGASYTPQADARGIDFDATRRTQGVESAHLENVLEGGVSFYHLFRQSDLRVRAAVTATHANTEREFAGFDDYSAWGAGLELEKGNWKTGFQYLDSNNAIASDEGRYKAVEIGLVREMEQWSFGGEYGYAEDDLQKTKSKAWSVALSRELTDSVNLSAGYMSASTEYQRPNQFGLNNPLSDGKGPFIEFSVRYK